MKRKREVIPSSYAYLGNASNINGKQFKMITTNANWAQLKNGIMDEYTKSIIKNSLIISAPQKEEPNGTKHDTGHYHLICTDSYGNMGLISGFNNIDHTYGLWYKDESNGSRTLGMDPASYHNFGTVKIDNSYLILNSQKRLTFNTEKIPMTSKDNSGLIKIDGKTLILNSDLSVKVNHESFKASNESFGVIKLDSFIENNPLTLKNGILNINNGTTQTKGVVKLDGETIAVDENDSIRVNTLFRKNSISYYDSNRHIIPYAPSLSFTYDLNSGKVGLDVYTNNLALAQYSSEPEPFGVVAVDENDKYINIDNGVISFNENILKQAISTNIHPSNITNYNNKYDLLYFNQNYIYREGNFYYFLKDDTNEEKSNLLKKLKNSYDWYQNKGNISKSTFNNVRMYFVEDPDYKRLHYCFDMNPEGSHVTPGKCSASYIITYLNYDGKNNKVYFSYKPFDILRLNNYDDTKMYNYNGGSYVVAVDWTNMICPLNGNIYAKRNIQTNL